MAFRNFSRSPKTRNFGNNHRFNSGYREYKQKLIEENREKYAHRDGLTNILAYNADMRRLTGIAIKNYLKQTGQITSDKVYVDFSVNKFSVITNGHLSTDYEYTVDFFANCFLGALQAFVNIAGIKYKHYLSVEGVLGSTHTTEKEQAEVYESIMDYIEKGGSNEPENQDEK